MFDDIFNTYSTKKAAATALRFAAAFHFTHICFFADHPAFHHAPIISSNQFISSTERCSNLVWGFQSG